MGHELTDQPDSPVQPHGAFQPLKHRSFREIWFASLMSNLALLITGVGAAWAMTLLTDSPGQIALVQSALMLPFLFLAMPAGAIADSYDRRRIVMIALCCASIANLALLIVAASGALTVWLLLGLCLLVGTANTMFAPSWQASVSEQVPSEDLPRAVAMNAISFNIARSFGPALGGVIVAVVGAAAAFAASAVLYAPMLVAFFRWKRQPEKPRLPPERVPAAIVSGVQYVAHSAAIRTVIARSFVYCVGASSIMGLMPLISKVRLEGGPLIFGALLACYGGGAVLGGVFLDRLRGLLGAEAGVERGAATAGLGIVALAYCTSLWAAVPVLLLVGCIWTYALTSLNVAVQAGAPRWVSGRVLAAFQATAAGGFAIGAWLWGAVAEATSIMGALVASGLTMFACAIVCHLLKLSSDIPDPAAVLDELLDPEVELALTGRSGPIILEVEYSVAEAEARSFYDAMLDIRRIRRRNGASSWTLARDVGNVRRWVERFQCPTWHDYLRQRSRLTADELSRIMAIAARYGVDGELRMTRLLERPVGSVRWDADTPDRGETGTRMLP